jgi:6-phosphofructo-2-kinase/fructose-2,6-biphosphatase 2
VFPPVFSLLRCTSLTNPLFRYRDVVIRLEPIIMELERSEDILIVTHQAVLRCIYAYFMKKSQADSPWMAVPLHTLIKLTPRAYGTQEERYDAKIPAVSTWRGKGSVAKHEDPTSATDAIGKGGDTAAA